MSKLQKIEIAGDSSNTVTLPEHLIIERILPRLPVKTLIRFKSVSKLWLSSISSPRFVKSHLKCSSSLSSGQFIFLIRNRNKDKDNCISFKLMSLAYDEMNNLKTPLDSDFPALCLKPNIKRVIIVGSSNGLVCLNIVTLEELSTPPCVPPFNLSSSQLHCYNMYYRQCPSFYVFNPGTRAYCFINYPNDQRSLSDYFWFGYIPSIDDYKIVYSKSGRDFYVYSLRIGEWKSINDCAVKYHIGFDRLFDSTSIIDDVLYCSPKHTDYPGRPNRIIGLDLAKEQFKEAPWMDWLTKSKYDSADFFVLNGCLSLLCFSHSCLQIRDVWTLRKQDDWSSWEKSFSVDLRDNTFIKTVSPTGKFLLGRDCKHFKIIGLNKDIQEGYDRNQFKITGLNKDTQEGYDRNQFKITSLNKDTQEGYDRNQFKIIGLNRDTQELSLGSEEIITSVMGYVESLVSPFGTIEPNEEEDRHEV